MTSNAIDGYIGTYYSEKSRGIYHFSFDPESGRMTEPELFYEAPNAKWVSAEGNCCLLYTSGRPGDGLSQKCHYGFQYRSRGIHHVQ